jgi:branched-chain amino acid transport system ATP-binding protein
MLEVRDLHASYAVAPVLRGLSLDVPDGHVVALLGRNGAGKTTLVRSVMGLAPPAVRSGSVRHGGTELRGLAPHEIARRGLGLVPQGRRMFRSLTVLEHLRIAARSNGGGWTADRVFDLFPQLAERGGHRGGALSGGEQQMLAIGRALMGDPSLLVMDEPSEGLAPQIIADVGRTIARLKGEGLSIVLVEQNIKLTLELADDIAIINSGRVVFTGAAGQIKINDAIVAQHLGVY